MADLSETLENDPKIELMKELDIPLCINELYPSYLIWCNEAWLNLWNASSIEQLRAREEASSKQWTSETHKKLKALRDKIQVQKKKHVQSIVITSDKKDKKVRLRQKPFKLNGKVYTLSQPIDRYGTLHNDALRAVQGFNNAATLLTLFSTGGVVIHQNEASVKFHGTLRPETEQGERNFCSLDVIHKIFPDEKTYQSMLKDLNDYDTYHHRLKMRSLLKTETRWHEVHVVPSTDPVTGQRMYIMNESDITILKMLEDEVVQMKEEAFSAQTSQKDEFLATCSHELRTPLNGIIGLSESLMGDLGQSDNQLLCDNIRTINLCGRRLLGLVNNILTASKLNQTKVQVSEEKIQLHEAVEEVKKLLLHGVAKDGTPLLGSDVIFENLIPVDFPVVLCDSNHIVQILNNLVGNAMKFTTQGSIRVSANVVNGMAEITVADSGRGIKASNLKRVFELFEQEEEANDTRNEGTGLGLAIVKTLVVSHGGELGVESEVGKGSTFRFTLHLCEDRDKEAQINHQSPAKPPKVPVARPTAVVKETEVKTPLSPANRLQRSVSHDQTSGVKMRAKSDDQDGQEQLKRAASFPPESPANLTRAAVSTRPEDMVIKSEKLILSVDDDPVNQMVLEQLLRRSGYNVVKAMDGQGALDILEKAPVFPDLILMDVMMPGMSGYEACDKIRESYSATVPIIMVSAKAGTDNVVEGLSHFCNDYVVKPFNKQEILSRIRTQLRLAQVQKIQLESKQNSALLDSMLPLDISNRLKRGQKLIADSYERVSILFTDIVGFTDLASSIPTEDVVSLLNDMFSRFDQLTDEFKVYKVETIGDAYMIACGHDANQADHCERIVKVAFRMLGISREIKTRDGRDVRIRIGVHTGPVVAGVVGTKNHRFCFFGDTVNVASRMETLGVPGYVHLSEPCYEALADSRSLDIVQRGLIRVKGKGMMKTYLALPKGAPEASDPDFLNEIRRLYPHEDASSDIVSIQEQLEQSEKQTKRYQERIKELEEELQKSEVGIKELKSKLAKSASGSSKTTTTGSTVVAVKTSRSRVAVQPETESIKELREQWIQKAAEIQHKSRIIKALQNRCKELAVLGCTGMDI